MKKLILVMILFVSSFTFASNSSDCKSAEEVLKNYIKLDSEGETTHTSKQVDELVYHNGRGTAGYDSMTIVSDAVIKNCRTQKSGLEISVTYKVLGDLAGNAKKKDLETILLSKPKESTESFYMIKDGTLWKIDSPSIHRPHVGINSAKKLVSL